LCCNAARQNALKGRAPKTALTLALAFFKLGLAVATQSPALAGQKSTDFGVLEATFNGGSKFRKKPIGTQVSDSG
jgi:hypothetical protein